MIIVDSFIEWFVILCGVILALGVIFPGVVVYAGKVISLMIPHPREVREWLNKHNL